MTTHKETIDFILDQVASAGEVGARRMFGEYALYLDSKVVALVCDDTLFVKITEPGKEYVRDQYQEGTPFEGAKAWLHVPEEMLDDHTWLSELLRTTADALPLPKPKTKRTK